MAGVFAYYAVNGLSPSTVGGTGTGLFYFPSPPTLNVWNSGAPGVNTNVSSNQQGGTPTSTNYTGQLSIPGNSVLNGQKFTVVASGNVLFGAGEASTTATIKVNANTGSIATPVVTDLLGTSIQLSNQALDGVYYPWSVQLDFVGDTLSGILQITKSAIVNGTLTGATSVTSLTGINFGGQGAASSVGTAAGASNFVIGLGVGVQFGASNSANAANLYQFYAYAN